MNKEEVWKLLCAQYCSFYKPGKDEELACQGFYIIQKLVDEGKHVPAGPDRIMLSVMAEEALFRVICRRCPFFDADCDFAAWRRGEGSNRAHEKVNPCGGFLCLGHCIEQGTVDIEDINRVI